MTGDDLCVGLVERQEIATNLGIEVRGRDFVGDRRTGLPATAVGTLTTGTIGPAAPAATTLTVPLTAAALAPRASLAPRIPLIPRIPLTAPVATRSITIIHSCQSMPSNLVGKHRPPTIR
ncbi:hypothetical protein, partial [Gordonia paraffinivorans]|uniref:hypothetical protein n=1 Tax=Gordonia paraffinivorans TaxID=175628 RepID=UPI0020D17C04